MFLLCHHPLYRWLQWPADRNKICIPCTVGWPWKVSKGFLTIHEKESHKKKKRYDSTLTLELNCRPFEFRQICPVSPCFAFSDLCVKCGNYTCTFWTSSSNQAGITSSSSSRLTTTFVLFEFHFTGQMQLLPTWNCLWNCLWNTCSLQRPSMDLI